MTFRPPMLASPSTASSNRQAVDYDQLMATGNWVVECKLDGLRAYVTKRGDLVWITNRNGVGITGQFPEIVESARMMQTNFWLDGEIVADDGKFETVLTRGKQEHGPAIMRMSETRPCRFVAFDAPDLHREPYDERRKWLEMFAKSFPDRFDLVPMSPDPAFRAKVLAIGLEGVIAKRRASRYQFGKRSRDFLKFKREDRVSCLVSGYTTGTGSRSSFGAMHVALVSPGGDIVPVGRVGTGFSEREIADLKARLDRSEVLVVEVRCLGLTGSDQLRMPVFLGIRTDIGPLDCSTDQLESLPRS